MTTFISIIIPALNAEDTLESCLLSIKELDYPTDQIETILVDNGSQDNTRNIARQFGCKVLLKPELKVGALRNWGAKYSKGLILAHTDSDCILPKNWLTTAVEILKNNSIGGVGGGCTVPENATWVEKSWISPRTTLVKQTKYLPGCNFILPKKIFNKVGGFNETVVAGEDDLLSIAITENGYKLISHKSCYVIHLGYPKTLCDVAKRQVWHGKSTIYAKKNWYDKMYLCSHLFTISILLLPFTLYFFYQSTSILLLILAPIFAVPILTAGQKLMRDKINHNLPIKIIPLSLIYFYFFIGRGIGLLLSYKTLLTSRCA